MQTTPSGPLVNNLHRLQRAVAESVAALAELSPVRALMALALTLGFGTSAAVAMASVGTPPDDQSRQVAVERPTPTVSRDSHRPEVTGSSAAAPEPAPSRSSTPDGRPSRSPKAQKPERSAPRVDESTPEEEPEMTDDGSSSSTEPSAPGADTSESSTDETPPETVLSEWFPDGDEAVFSFTAGESATYECSFDGAPYSSCDSPATYKDLHPGWHTFVVRAVDEAGNVDPTPASIRWHANAGSADAHEAN
jgi:hypothetical protein